MKVLILGKRESTCDAVLVFIMLFVVDVIIDAVLRWDEDSDWSRLGNLGDEAFGKAEKDGYAIGEDKKTVG